MEPSRGLAHTPPWVDVPGWSFPEVDPGQVAAGGIEVNDDDDTADEDLFENSTPSEGNPDAMNGDEESRVVDITAATEAADVEQNTEAGNLQSAQVDTGANGETGAQEGDVVAQDVNANTAAAAATGAEQPQDQHHVEEANQRDACKICFERLAPVGLIYLNCGCLYCVECLNAHFRSGLANKASYPPVCCGPIDIAAVQGFLDIENLIRYYNVLDEFAADYPLYCANKECDKGFIGDVAYADMEEDQGMVICPECALETCAKCRELRDAHVDNEGVLECPDSLELAEVKEMADQEKWRQCPGCRHLVEKIDGCDHMICDCRTEFHYVCGQGYGNDGRCGCTHNPGWGDNGDHDGQDEADFLEAQLPPHIQDDLHRDEDFPFAFQGHHNHDIGDPTEVIRSIITDTREWVGHLPDRGRDNALVAEDGVMQEDEGEEDVRPLGAFIEGGEATGAASFPPTVGDVLEATRIVQGAGEIEDAGQQAEAAEDVEFQGEPADGAEEEDEAAESERIETIEDTVRTALVSFEIAFGQLRTTTTTLVREKRLRAERMLGRIEQAAWGRGGGAGRGRGIRGGRGGGMRGGMVHHAFVNDPWVDGTNIFVLPQLGEPGRGRGRGGRPGGRGGRGGRLEAARHLDEAQNEPAVPFTNNGNIELIADPEAAAWALT